MNTSEKIRQLRIAKGLSQEALGELVGVKKAAINKYETGRVVNIKRSTLQKLAAALDVHPADLLDDVADNNDACTPVAAPALSDPEQTLVGNYRQLNAEGQEKLIDYSDDLVSSPKYKKCDIASVVEETA